MKKAIVLLVFMASSFMTFAQCAMCRANAESASQHVDKGIGESLNSGILYLMGIPYVLLMTVGIVFFRKRIAAFFKG
ncbi:MAG: hypothetical protein ACOYLH_07245 [Flavobacteriales bacterium]